MIANPNCLEANHPSGVARCEQALVGSVLLDPTRFDLVQATVSAGDFQDDHLGLLFAALLTLKEARKPISDFTWLTAELARMKIPEEVRAGHALLKLTDAAVHSGHAKFYAEQVAVAARLRRLVGIGSDLRDRAAAPDAEPDAIADWLESKLASLDRSRQIDARLVGEVAADVVAEIEANANNPEPTRGTFTGLGKLDSAAGPMMPGEMIVVAARPGDGKTAMGTQIALHAAERGRKPLIVSLEMQDTEITRRLLCERAELDSRDVRAGRVSQGDRAKLREAMVDLNELPARVWAPPSATMGDIRGVARYVKATSGLDLLVVDYIGRIQPGAEDRRLQGWEQVSKVSGALKTLAKELAVPLLALCQLNREADGEEPRLSHLARSGAIEQDADAVWFIHHPARNPDDAPQQGGLECSLLIGKHRHGETGRVGLLWYPGETRFESPGIF